MEQRPGQTCEDVPKKCKRDNLQGIKYLHKKKKRKSKFVWQKKKTKSK